MRKYFDWLLNLVTIFVLALAAAGAIRPGSAIRSGIDSWQAQRALAKTWPALQDIASRLDSGSGVVKLVEFGDYECPFCKRAHDTLRALMSRVPELGIVYRHYPLANHPAAEGAARAAICAEGQGKFRSIHSYFYKNENWKTDRNWIAAARAVGVPDLENFEVCLNHPATTQRLRDDIALAQVVGIKGTPAFYSRTGVLVGAPTDSAVSHLLGRE